MSPPLDQPAPRAPYLLCACRNGDKRFGTRCRKGATHLKDGYAVCSEHADNKKLKLHLTVVRYDILKPTLHDQFSRELE